MSADVTGPSPAIVLVASGTHPASLVLPPEAELGRRTAAAGVTHELSDERLSRDHARVRWERGLWTVTDLESRNGTFLDGDRVIGQAQRRGTAVLRLGNSIFLLLADGRGHPAPDDEPVVGPELERTYARLRELATGSQAPGGVVLVQGEPGTGKTLAARVFHEAGPRAAGPFVPVNCGALPEGMAERLLFGHVKRAAVPIQSFGHVQLARGGTLLLDDIAELEATAQLAVLRLIDDPARELGLVVAGSQLRAAVSEGRLFEELYRRLSGCLVQLPLLRERKVDLVRHVQHAVAAVGPTLGVHARVLEACLLRPWPGNVRELRAAITLVARRVLDEGRDLVRPEDLPDTAGLPPGAASGETAVERKQPGAAAGALDAAALSRALEEAGGVVSVAARALGVHRSQLYRLLDEHGIAHDDS